MVNSSQGFRRIRKSGTCSLGVEDTLPTWAHGRNSLGETYGSLDRLMSDDRRNSEIQVASCPRHTLIGPGNGEGWFRIVLSVCVDLPRGARLLASAYKLGSRSSSQFRIVAVCVVALLSPRPQLRAGRKSPTAQPPAPHKAPTGSTSLARGIFLSANGPLPDTGSRYGPVRTHSNTDGCSFSCYTHTMSEVWLGLSFYLLLTNSVSLLKNVSKFIILVNASD
jgi:hypothetical protein